MRTLRYRVIAIIALVTFLTSFVSGETQAQVTNLYRGSVKSHGKKTLRSKKRLVYQLPDSWIEIPKAGPPKIGLSDREFIEISPVPTPIPKPVPHHERVGISPVPTPIPRPVPYHERVGISPIPTPTPRPRPDQFDSDAPLSLLDELIDLYADAVLRGDFGAADLIEELIVINPYYNVADRVE